VWAGATLINRSADKQMGKLVIEVVGVSATSGSVFFDLIGGAALTQDPIDGFYYWFSIGF
jgi:hypothetical protein